MARHRDVRNMDYSDDYDGYDDVYGHSVEDDYYVSPSHNPFMYNRDLLRGPEEQDIQEETEHEIQQGCSNSTSDKTKIDNCLKQIRSTLNVSNIPEDSLIKIIIENNFDDERIMNTILDLQKSKESEVKKLKDETSLVRNFISKCKLQSTNSDSVSSFLKKIPKPENNVAHDQTFLSKIKSSSKVNTTKNEIVFPNLIRSSDLVKTSKPAVSFANLPNSSDSESKVNFSKIFLNRLQNLETKKGLQNSNLLKASKSETINSVHLTNPELTEPSKSCTLLTNKEIDLSNALKIVTISDKNNTNQKSISLKGDFKIPFIDCDPRIQDAQTVLPCSFTCIKITSKKLGNMKRVSQFGKILCLSLKARKPPILNEKSIRIDITRFAFDKPSPDDNIIKHLGYRL